MGGVLYLYFNRYYLFGSYAKGKATEPSDVDLLISTSVSGMTFYDLVEFLREALQKKVDVLNREQLNDNSQLINEILRHGVKIKVKNDIPYLLDVLEKIVD